MAVDTNEGLIVPVLRGVDQLSLSEVSFRMRKLIDKTRNRQLRIVRATRRGLPVFTISNLGNFRIDSFAPILYMHQAAILGIGRITQDLAVYAGEISVRDIVTLSLTCDHRVIDGAAAAKLDWSLVLQRSILGLTLLTVVSVATWDTQKRPIFPMNTTFTGKIE